MNGSAWPADYIGPGPPIVAPRSDHGSASRCYAPPGSAQGAGITPTTIGRQGSTHLPPLKTVARSRRRRRTTVSAIHRGTFDLQRQSLALTYSDNVADRRWNAPGARWHLRKQNLYTPNDEDASSR